MIKKKVYVTIAGKNPLYRVKALIRCRKEEIRLNDSKIVELYLSRNESAISQTAHKYGFRLRRIANNILNNNESAEECENDTYLEAWNLIPPNEPRTYLFAFLGKIIRHISIDMCRRNSAKKRYAIFCELTQEMHECIPGNSDVMREVEVNALTESIDTFLEACSLEQRNVFVRRYWFFDTISEICKLYGYSQSKVKTMLFRMRKELQIHLEKEGYTI
jgi:RNA polymerase sigma factor (sigma-70 family)